MKAIQFGFSHAALVDIPASDTRDELTALQNIIGGYIETIRIKDDAVLLVDEDGLMKGLMPNPTATNYVGRIILGTALLVGLTKNENGEMVFSDVPEHFYG